MDEWTPVPKPPIGMTPGEIRRWVLKGLVMSCISAHTLHRWIVEVSHRPVHYPLLVDVLVDFLAADLIEVQRRVVCYVCDGYLGNHPVEDGFALTPKGEMINNELGNEEVFA